MSAIIDGISVIVNFLNMLLDKIVSFFDLVIGIAIQSRFVFTILPGYLYWPIALVVTVGVLKLFMNHGGNTL